MYKKKMGDRTDGYRLNNVDVLFQLIPYVMRTRLDSQCFFEEDIDFAKIDAMVNDLRRNGYPHLRAMHVIIAAVVRLMAMRPHLNRFICGNKAYARNSITVAIAMKKDMSDEGEETTVKVDFDPMDSLFDVAQKVEKIIMDNKPADVANDTDVFAGLVGRMPSFILRIFINMLMWMDRCGILPKAIIKLSPFHSSFFITNLGSLGIRSIYHHLYEFGTTSYFIAMGTKDKVLSLNDHGLPVIRKVMSLKFVTDERICDGFYNASSMLKLKRMLKAPECLLEKLPPEMVVLDNGIVEKKKRWVRKSKHVNN